MHIEVPEVLRLYWGQVFQGIMGTMPRASRLHSIIMFVFCVCVAAAAGQNAWAAGLKNKTVEKLTIDSIRYGNHSGQSRIVIDLSRASDYRAFLLENPYRLVVDIPNAGFSIGHSGFVNDTLIKGYRSGDLNTGLTRVIFDLNAPAEIASIFALPARNDQKDRLVVDLKSTSANLFTYATRNIYGNKDIAGGTNGHTGAVGAPAESSLRQSDNTAAAAANPMVDVPLPTRKPGIAGVAGTDKKIYTIIIDAGHGGEDPGAIGAGGVREKNITLATALALARKLEDTGRYRAVLTRNKDIFIPLRQRVDIARRAKGDLFIAVHADKVDRTNVRGASIYTLSETSSDAETARLADEDNRAGVVSGVDLSQETQDVADILLDLAMREKMNESNVLAGYIGDAMRRNSIGLLPNSHRSAGFAVLKAPDIPSTLIEIGFLSNPDEAKLLNSGQFQSRFADAILDGIDAYFTKIRALQKL